MRLNDLRRAKGARKERKRVARGTGSGLGKTAGRGHNGLKSRSGGRVSPGFEGGQMPLQRRLPKVGFRSRMARTTAEVRLDRLGKVEGDAVTLEGLKAAGVIPHSMERAKIIGSGEIAGPVTVRGLRVTKGARAAIEAAGGRVED
ncbi:large subunit ribosomal protein L15 [Thiohalospira halophila DSM 15071]|uniref:Large ribosomal subunit protein uL15 n=1 Tax=Thiohalospira halophila DSM 15071 TaxID=1123397 RepID=A0A1I1PVU6_9GAMM|nr:50S ribosomal protein L15 [Thiohalospira halophila]SFD13782.1 large subunit ribosomal protein L15 [Thiohalospira halophila DSM 15071]